MAMGVIVVGGGLAGLAAARRLAAAGRDVRVLERREELGGRVRSRHHEGYVLDRGFQVLFTAYPAARRELDYDALELRRFKPGAVLARRGERSVLADPLRDPGAALETALNREVTVGDKLRTLRLRWALRNRSFDEILEGGSDTDIRTYLRERGFSERFLERFVAPFYGGITLDRSLSTSSRVFEYTFKTLAAGGIAVPAEGMGAIPGQLASGARTAGARIETGRTVTDVQPAGDQVDVIADGETLRADAVVVATDPPTARELTGVGGIPTRGKGCITQYYRLPRRPALDGGRRLVLNLEDDAPNQIAPLTAIAPKYAPAGESLLSATFLGTPDADEEALAERTRTRLSEWYPEASFRALEVVHTDRIEFAQFEQPPGFRSRLPAVDAPAGRVYLAGDYTRWCSINGALESGRAAAEALRRGTGLRSA